ncbi:hypothetical protein COO91_01231 [Nostoc flagelliforme CCNUN1]|uniref:Uncharacterized protein n=1 Tax=Nostoc flagelliforme CCNUN1 TaxID=2038116 RepID=A0A2K8SJ76_9NOSO|nr:hypothetical protein [Nostoc flagelliforme]AUB35353.1 hypothetical protein COO91_01231 [Nostoc flagelliforme CCNUN1]
MTKALCDRSEVRPEQKFLNGRLQADFGGRTGKASGKLFGLLTFT